MVVLMTCASHDGDDAAPHTLFPPSGHYLTALSYAWLTGNSTARERIETLVTELGKVQQVKLVTELTSQQPASHHSISVLHQAPQVAHPLGVDAQLGLACVRLRVGVHELLATCAMLPADTTPSL
jgi:hypothetical protein